MRTLTEQYRSVKEGKGPKDVFLKEAKDDLKEQKDYENIKNAEGSINSSGSFLSLIAKGGFWLS